LQLAAAAKHVKVIFIVILQDQAADMLNQYTL
jgi:hypothetical protein